MMKDPASFMKTNMRIGIWQHWFKMEYHLGMMLRELGLDVADVDYRKKGYLEDLDILIINQNAVNDCIENDRNYFHSFVKRGGVCWILHQDHFRCNPCFLPVEAGRPLLVNRYYSTLQDEPPSTSYLLPIPEDAGKVLFNVPNRITMDEMVYWKLDTDSFCAVKQLPPREVTTCALSAITDTDGWEILGSYVDPAMPINDSALIMQRTYGDGLFFWSQLLFPETKKDSTGKVFKFWARFAENTLEHFRRFKEKLPAPVVPDLPKAKDNTTPGWRRTITHLHSLDWFAADNHFGGIAGAMRELKFDVGVIGFKDALSYLNKPEYEKYCDDKVTILPGMEYHPFNFDGSKLPNIYHILAMGDISCSDEFTRTIFDEGDLEEYVKGALDHIKKQGGVSCVTHPTTPYWRKYDFDAVDTYDFENVKFKNGEIERRPFRGTDQEQAWLDGSHITLMASVDMWGIERLRANPVFNFIWYDGAPTLENLVKAVKAGHVIPGFGVDSADIRINDYLPGDTVPAEQMTQGIRVQLSAPEALTAVELYADDQLISVYVPEGDGREVDTVISTAGLTCKRFLRIEVRGKKAHLIANPFFIS